MKVLIPEKIIIITIAVTLVPKDPDADSDAELVQCSENDLTQKNTRITGCRGRQRSKPGKQTVTGKQATPKTQRKTGKHWKTL